MYSAETDLFPFSVIEKYRDVSHEFSTDAIPTPSKKSVLVQVRGIVEKERVVGLRLHGLVHDLSLAMV